MDTASKVGNSAAKEDSIAKRVANFNAKTRPIVAKYNAKIVNAERSAVDIFADVEKLFAAL